MWVCISYILHDIQTHPTDMFCYILLFLFLEGMCGTCVDNCNAYSVYINTPSEYYGYNLFYLFNGNKTECKHCYFDVNAYNSYGNYYFSIGLYDPTTTKFTEFAKGTMSTTSGFDICGIYGYCAVWFSTSFTSFTMQTIPLGYDVDASTDVSISTDTSVMCNYNSTYCAGKIPGYMPFTHSSNSFFNYYRDCAI